MHGLGNDFVIIDAIAEPFSLNKKQIRLLANRNFGIGFDQLLVIRQSKTPSVDFSYQIFNVMERNPSTAETGQDVWGSISLIEI